MEWKGIVENDLFSTNVHTSSRVDIHFISYCFRIRSLMSNCRGRQLNFEFVVLLFVKGPQHSEIVVKIIFKIVLFIFTYFDTNGSHWSGNTYSSTGHTVRQTTGVRTAKLSASTGPIIETFALSSWRDAFVHNGAYWKISNKNYNTYSKKED